MDIFEASKQGYIEIVKELIENKLVDINSQNKDGDSALNLSIINAHFEIVKYLLYSGANPNIKDNDKVSPLMAACMSYENINDYLQIIKLLLKYNVDINAQDIEGNTALFHALMCSNKIEIVDLLLKAGADPNIKNNDGDNALILLFSSNGDILKRMLRTKRVKLLLENGVDYNIKTKESVHTALTIASILGKIKIVSLLLDYNIDIYHKTEFEVNAFDYACYYLHINIIKLFIEKYGYDKFISYNTIDIICDRNSINILKIILGNGYTRCINQKFDNYSIRDLAIKYKRIYITKLLDKTFVIPFLYKRFRKINNDIIRESLYFV
jgi:ankyrin repeat protein